MKKSIFFAHILCLCVTALLAQSTDEILKQLNGKINFEVWKCDGNKVSQKFAIPVSLKTGSLQIENSTWKCDIRKSTVNKDGSINFEATFKLEKGNMKSASVAVSCPFKDWETENYVMIPSIVYNGNRFHTLSDLAALYGDNGDTTETGKKKSYSGWLPFFPAGMHYNSKTPLAFNNGSHLSINPGEPSKIELSTSSAATPAMSFYSPSKKYGFILLTDQATRLGNSGLYVEENKDRSEAVFSLSAPVVREYIPGFGSFFKSDDKAADWKEGDEVTLKFSVYTFQANDIPQLLTKFMDVRKTFTGNNKTRDLAPMSAIFDFIKFQIDNYRIMNINAYSDNNYNETLFDYKNVFQLGWCGGLINSFPMLYSNKKTQLERVSNTMDLVIDQTQGKSGFCYAMYADGKNVFELNRELPLKLQKEHPNVMVALVRKNADALFWLIKHLQLFKETGNAAMIKPSWEAGTKRLAEAFVRTWKKYGELGQYIDPNTGDIVIFNSTSSAMASGGLALASKYFNNPEFLQAAKEMADFYYKRDVVGLGLTSGNCADIAQDADSESSFAFLESLMALYYVTGEKQWLDKAKVQAALCATWVVSYNFAFPADSDLGKLNVLSTGAVFASTQNKHAAPGICTSSGSSLFKLFRATGNRKYADLLNDIQRAHTEVVELPNRPTVTVGSGGSWGGASRENYYGCSQERFQITDSERKEGVGRLAKNTSVHWCEANGILMAMEIPGIYVQTDKNELYVFDEVEATVVKRDALGVTLKIKNSTAFDANVSVFAETAAQAKKPQGYMDFVKWKKVNVPAGKTITAKIQN